MHVDSGLFQARVFKLCLPIILALSVSLPAYGNGKVLGGKMEKTYAQGIYKCAKCHTNLFSSKAMFDAGAKWPSFWEPIDPANLSYSDEDSLGMIRTQVHCVHCKTILGYVYDEGPAPTHKTYCINPTAIEFLQEKVVPVSKIKKLSPELRKILNDQRCFHTITSLKNIPEPIVALIAGNGPGIADSGNKWEATDSISDITLPRKRLVWASTDNEHYLIHYEQGGIGHLYRFVVLRMIDGKINILWQGFGKLEKDHRSFLKALDTGLIDDSFAYNL